MTHKGTCSGIEEFDRYNLEQTYLTMHMLSNELLADYKVRFENAISAVKQAGGKTGSPKSIAMRFLLSLHKGRYTKFQVELRNDQTIRKIPIPSS